MPLFFPSKGVVFIDITVTGVTGFYNHVGDKYHSWVCYFPLTLPTLSLHPHSLILTYSYSSPAPQHNPVWLL